MHALVLTMTWRAHWYEYVREAENWEEFLMPDRFQNDSVATLV
jgi:hypothetical protein